MHVSLDTVVARLLDDDYRAGRPPWISPAEAAADRVICGASRCTACGGKGLAYHPFHRPADHSYLIVAECVQCGHSRLAGEGVPVEVMQPAPTRPEPRRKTARV